MKRKVFIRLISCALMLCLLPGILMFPVSAKRLTMFPLDCFPAISSMQSIIFPTRHHERHGPNPFQPLPEYNPWHVRYCSLSLLRFVGTIPVKLY